MGGGTHDVERRKLAPRTVELYRSHALRYQHATDSRDVAIADAVADRLARRRPEPRDGRAMEQKRATGPKRESARNPYGTRVPGGERVTRIELA